jgi:hypothetical protein
MYLQLLRIALAAVICEYVGPEGSGTWRLKMQLSQECFAGMHTAVFAVSCFILLLIGIGFPTFSLYFLRKWRMAKTHRAPANIEKLGHLYAHFKDGMMVQMVVCSFALRWLLASKGFFSSNKIVGFVIVAAPNVALIAVYIWKAPSVNTYLNKVEPVRYAAETACGLAMLLFFGASSIAQTVMAAVIVSICAAIIVSRFIPAAKKAKGDVELLSKSVSALHSLLKERTSRHDRPKEGSIIYRVTVTTSTPLHLHNQRADKDVCLQLVGDVEGPSILLTKRLLESVAPRAPLHHRPLTALLEATQSARNLVAAKPAVPTGPVPIKQNARKILRSWKTDANELSWVFVLGVPCDLGEVHKVLVTTGSTLSASKFDSFGSSIRVEGPKGCVELFPSSKSALQEAGDSTVVEFTVRCPHPEPDENALARAKQKEQQFESDFSTSSEESESEESDSEEEPELPSEVTAAEQKKADRWEVAMTLDPDLCVREEDRERFTCSICFRFLSDPVILNNGDAAQDLQPCGHGPYCMRCVKLALRDGRCPDCRQYTTISMVIIDMRLVREMRSCKLRCKHHAHGCDWIGEYGYVADHIHRCQYASSSHEAAAATEPYDVNPHIPNAVPSRPSSAASTDSSSTTASSRARRPLSRSSSWRPIDISHAVEKVPPDVRPTQSSSHVGSRPSSASVRLAIPPHMESLFERLSTPEDQRQRSTNLDSPIDVDLRYSVAPALLPLAPALLPLTPARVSMHNAAICASSASVHEGYSQGTLRILYMVLAWQG